MMHSEQQIICNLHVKSICEFSSLQEQKESLKKCGGKMNAYIWEVAFEQREQQQMVFLGTSCTGIPASCVDFLATKPTSAKQKSQ